MKWTNDYLKGNHNFRVGTPYRAASFIEKIEIVSRFDKADAN
ncbi:TPA: hypothetical protein ACQNFD_001737 [Streptococcus pyogenes]|nr:hypothetical protein SPYALAB49_001862 [Streptococcus pyogenes Alab49]AFC67058.1 hypothetical protein MGAS15252_1748 [Streptococcus pyogenes MGAS15252]AFC68960.1 hypothetical protein MGAS1882_1782 [Streptococcus pyogenes MGAS1882]AMY98402.1 Hypothetical protein AUQ45_1857 [Streptococcus pyogenes]KGE55065.1 hypothetical protein SPYAA216_1836 [Streptococcus pyogenes AA216]KGE61426.1 hypothetical protein MGAS2111_0003 [Streptococcus pyogenes MGAS2111]CCG26383.1 FIG01116071: hypothetical protei